jgi:hypothetical protein
MPAANLFMIAHTVSSDDVARHWIIVVLSTGFSQGTDKNLCRKDRALRVAAPVLTPKIWSVSHKKPAALPEHEEQNNDEQEQKTSTKDHEHS